MLAGLAVAGHDPTKPLAPSVWGARTLQSAGRDPRRSEADDDRGRRLSQGTCWSGAENGGGRTTASAGSEGLCADPEHGSGRRRRGRTAKGRKDPGAGLEFGQAGRGSDRRLVGSCRLTTDLGWRTGVRQGPVRARRSIVEVRRLCLDGSGRRSERLPSRKQERPVRSDSQTNVDERG